MDSPYGSPWSTHEYTEHSQVNSSYYYCLSPTLRYLHTTGTEPGGTQVDNCLRIPPLKIPCGIAQRNSRVLIIIVLVFILNYNYR
jgi:hypothetical protein